MDSLPLWIRGTLLCLFGSTLTALGLVLQKQSHSAESADNAQKRSYWARPWWLFGFALFLSAQLINMVSMALTPQTVLSCLGSWTLVCNTLFARVILGEYMSRVQVIACCGLVLATAAVVSTAPRPPNDDGLRTSVGFLASRFLCWEFDVLTIVMFCSACTLWVLSLGTRPRSIIDDSALKDDGALDEKIHPLAQASANAASATALEAAEFAKRSLAPLSRAMAAAIASGYTALLFKCLAELIASAGVAAVDGKHGEVDDSNPWLCWQTYAIAIVALSCAPAELHFLNLALQLGDAIFVVPVYLALGMTSQLLTGMVFFEEYKNFASHGNILEFALSVAITLSFVVMMANAQATRDDLDEVVDPLQEPFLDGLPVLSETIPYVCPPNVVYEQDADLEIPSAAQGQFQSQGFLGVPARWTAPPRPASPVAQPQFAPVKSRPMSLDGHLSEISVSQPLGIPPSPTPQRIRGMSVEFFSPSLVSCDGGFEGMRVSTPGFGGAIECLDAVNRGRSKTAGGPRDSRLGSASEPPSDRRGSC